MKRWRSDEGPPGWLMALVVIAYVAVGVLAYLPWRGVAP